MFKKFITNSKIILAVIVLLGSFLRFYSIQTVPPGTHADEAETGYSAYSILKTGKTQYGSFNFLALEEISGTHPPLYTYVLIPLVYFFGLNIVVERLPSMIFGILTIPLFYFLLLSIFRKRNVALTGAFLLAVNPWSIHMSHQGLLEATALFFSLGGILFFVLAKKREIFYILSAIFLGLSLHAYDAPKIFIPIFLFVMVAFQWKSIRKANKKIVAISTGIFLIFFLLMLYSLVAVKQFGDYERTSLLDKAKISEVVNTRREQTNAPLWISSIFSNKATIAIQELTAHYLDSFKPNWFFGSGSNNYQRGFGNHGQYYLFILPLMLFGISLMAKNNKKLLAFLSLWFLIGAIPGSITQTGNLTYRNILILPIPLIFSSVGLIRLFSIFSKNTLKNRIAKAGIVLIFFISIVNFCYIYFFSYPVYAASFWSKQQGEALKYAEEEKGRYTKVYIDAGLDWPNIYAFQYSLNPKLFQQEYERDRRIGDTKVMEFGNLIFGNFDLKTENPLPFEKNSLIITNGQKYKGFKSIKNFYDPGGVWVEFKAFEYK